MPALHGHIFVYRDCFFWLEDLYLWGENEKKICLFESVPTLKDLRKECDKYIEELVMSSIRAGGEVLCEECGKPLRSHPYFRGAFAFGNEGPYLHRRCDGVLVKL